MDVWNGKIPRNGKTNCRSFQFNSRSVVGSVIYPLPRKPKTQQRKEAISTDNQWNTVYLWSVHTSRHRHKTQTPIKNGFNYNMQNCSDCPTRTPTKMQMGCKPILSVSVSVSVSVSTSVNTPLLPQVLWKIPLSLKLYNDSSHKI